MKIVDVTPQNVKEETLFCIRDIKKPGFACKQLWFEKRYAEGLRMKILKEETGRMIGFIEYVSASKAWRPVDAPNFMFIHCITVYSKKDREKGLGSMLINEAENDARRKDMSGLCVMTSKGAWIADKQVFERNGFQKVDEKDRFKLLSKKWDNAALDPKLIDWTAKQSKYKGWHLIYADQCPWHEKSVFDILKTTANFNIDIKVTKLITSRQAKNAPSGYGVFSLLYNGKLLEDHYISATRFKNIVQKEIEITN